MPSKLFTLILIAFIKTPLFAQGIRGYIRNEKGEVLPNASLFVQELKTASSSNVNGNYAIKLSPGKYTLIARYVGFRSAEFSFEINNEWIDKDIILTAQNVELKEVSIGKLKSEDFAYTIMRKAIAKRKFNQLLYKGFRMMAYIKGSGQLTDAPFFARKKLEKEGLKMDEAYATESVSQFKFSQPNKIEEKVVSVRTRGENPVGVSPSNFLNESFYNDKVSGLISPLASSAFRYYQFRYEGSFTEKGRTIFKVSVKPRSKGDNLFDGQIFILDDLFALHSLSLRGTLNGFPLQIKQNYAEVANSVFLPITHQLQISINILGFKGQFKYLVSCSNYQVDLNPDLNPALAVADEKTEELPTVSIGKAGLSENRTLSRKELSKMMDKYEKETFLDKSKPKLLADRSFSIDKMATKRDSNYWDSIRPVPLTVGEQKGYRTIDSITIAEKKAKADSIEESKTGFRPKDLLFGKSYHITNNQSFTLNPLLFGTYFNPVEGFNINLGGTYHVRTDTSASSVNISPLLRYGFSINKLYAKMAAEYNKKRTEHGYQLGIEGGYFTEQLNHGLGVWELNNTVTSLLATRNYMKLYQRIYIQPSFSYSLRDNLKISGNILWEDRHQLFNNSDYTWNKRGRTYSDNSPSNVELSNTSFPDNQAFVGNVALFYRPFVQYSVYNGKTKAIFNRSPEFKLLYKKAFKDVLGSDADFDFLQVGVNHSVDIGAGNRLSAALEVGSFLNNGSVYFMDYKHFEGSRMTLNIASGPSFRLLDYYQYSTSNSFISGNFQYSFRKFLITRIMEARLSGIKEKVFFNYLKTSNSPHYYEIGYSLDNIFRILRLDIVTSFVNRNREDAGIRVGLTSQLRVKRK